MNYDLPTTVTLRGEKWAIRSDFRAILDICTALTDPNLTNEEKGITTLCIFYEDCDDLPQGLYEDAIKECFKFINVGEEENGRKSPKLMDWEQDFMYIIAAINKVVGAEIRAVPYLHWWTFVSAYYEIGDCTFAQIVRIRSELAKGKKLSDFDRQWYREHKDLVDIKTSYSDAEQDILKTWGA